MKFFADYLIEKKMVNPDQMVSALIRQSGSVPSIMEIIHSQRIIPSEDMMEIFKNQQENKLSFVESAKDLGFWNDEIQGQIDRFISAARTPLPKVLEEMNIAKQEAITHAFDEFLGDLKIKEPTPAKETVAIVEENPATTVSASPAQEQSPQLIASTPTAGFDSYCNLFNEEKMQSLVQSFEQLKTGGVSVSILATLKSTLEQLTDVANLVTAKESWSILGSMNAIVDQLGKIPATSLNDELIIKIGKVNLDAVSLLWKFRQILTTGKTESEMIQSDPELKKNYEMVSGGVELTRFDLDFLI